MKLRYSLLFVGQTLAVAASNTNRSGDKAGSALSQRDASWTLSHSYSGPTFFDGWDFWDRPDPTDGQVNYLAANEAWSKGLVYLQNEQTPVIQVDSWTNLPAGANRNSVRMTSKTTYSGGLFVFDVQHIPTGCSVWPAIWLVGPDWPVNGEIDVIETVHNNDVAQLTLHTADGCYLTNPGDFSGTAGSTDCGSSPSKNTGCSIKSQQGTTGPTFNHGGGGVYVLQWDGSGIRIWIFKRAAAIPSDIVSKSPNPFAWRVPDAFFSAASCDPYKYFKDLQIVIDITLCGTYGSGSFASSGCSGSCSTAVMTGANYVNASFIVNAIDVYTLQGAGPAAAEAGAATDSLADPTAAFPYWPTIRVQPASATQARTRIPEAHHLALAALLVAVTGHALWF